MCKKTNYKIPNPRIDKCLRNLIEILQCRGVVTVASCCGHNKYPMSIVIKQGFENKPYNFEIMSGKVIPRKRNIYNRDEQGYYFIPEMQSDERICKCGHKKWSEHRSSFYDYKKDVRIVAQECNVKGCKCKKFKLKR